MISFHGFLFSNMRLLCPTLSIRTCHCCSSSAFTAFSACTLPAMVLASTHLTPLCSITEVLHTPASTQTNFFTTSFDSNTLLHQALFAEIHFYTNQLLHKLACPQTTFHTNQLLHKRAFTHTSFYAKPLFNQPAFTQNHPLHQPTFTNQLLHKLTFRQTTLYANHLLHPPWNMGGLVGGAKTQRDRMVGGSLHNDFGRYFQENKQIPIYSK